MPFPNKIRSAVVKYVERHLPGDSFYKDYFWFISDVGLRQRLEEEFRSVRYIYKLLEGLGAEGWLQSAQVKVQILLYASIYEAALHHVLLQDYASAPQVTALSSYEHRKAINISADIRGRIQKACSPAGPIHVYEIETKGIDERKIVFEDKAKVALALGLIDATTKGVICKVYSLRNAIHLHAELRRGVKYEMQQAKTAYRRLKVFCEQVSSKMVADGKIPARPPVPARSRRRVSRSVPADSWLKRIVAWFRKP